MCVQCAQTQNTRVRKKDRKKEENNKRSRKYSVCILCVCVCVSYTIGSVCALLMRVCIGNIGIYTHQISVRVFLYEPTANLFRRLFCVFLFVFVLLFFFNKMMIIIIIADSHTGYLCACVYVMCVRASVSPSLSIAHILLLSLSIYCLVFLKIVYFHGLYFRFFSVCYLLQ